MPKGADKKTVNPLIQVQIDRQVFHSPVVVGDLDPVFEYMLVVPLSTSAKEATISLWHDAKTPLPKFLGMFTLNLARLASAPMTESAVKLEKRSGRSHVSGGVSMSVYIEVQDTARCLLSIPERPQREDGYFGLIEKIYSQNRQGDKDILRLLERVRQFWRITKVQHTVMYVLSILDD